MARNYYCTVAGLLDLELNASALPGKFCDIVDEVTEGLHELDLELVRLIRYQYDNNNLISLLKKNERFDIKGNYTQEELLVEIDKMETLPLYMSEFLEIYDESVDNSDGKIWDDVLAEKFYSYVQKSDSEFIRKWFEFDLNLRNTITAINLRNDVNKHFENVFVGNNDVVDALTNSNLPDFGLSTEHPWINEIISADTNSLIEYEQIFDKIRWDFVNELTTFSYFEIDTILAFCIKLVIVVRWLNLDDKLGKERLGQLLQELKSGVNLNS